MRKKSIAIVLATALLAAVALLALAPKMAPSRSLAPAIFISYDDEGNESRIFFQLSAETGGVSVDACDDANFGKPWGRYLEPTSFEYDPTTGRIRFDGMTWEISGKPGNRVLKNTEVDYGVPWGTYYENPEDASAAKPYHYERPGS